jgi:hypothetical protein
MVTGHPQLLTRIIGWGALLRNETELLQRIDLHLPSTLCNVKPKARNSFIAFMYMKYVKNDIIFSQVCQHIFGFYFKNVSKKVKNVQKTIDNFVVLC